MWLLMENILQDICVAAMLTITSLQQLLSAFANLIRWGPELAIEILVPLPFLFLTFFLQTGIRITIALRVGSGVCSVPSLQV